MPDSLPHPRKPVLGRLLQSLGVLLIVVAFFFNIWQMWAGATVNKLRAFGVELPAGTATVLSLILMGVGSALIKKSRKLTADTADTVLARDPRPPVLLLRSFSDDEIVAGTPGYGSQLFAQPVTLEEALAPVLERLGPVIAIGRPGERSAPVGAARAYVSNEAWQQTVHSWLERARLVVMVMGPVADKPGLAWELERVRELGGLAKLLLVMPPLADADCAARWGQYRDALGNLLPPYSGGEIFVAFGSNGAAQIVKAEPGQIEAGKVGKTDTAIQVYAASLGALLGAFETPPARAVAIESGPTYIPAAGPKPSSRFARSGGWVALLVVLTLCAIGVGVWYFGPDSDSTFLRKQLLAKQGIAAEAVELGQEVGGVRYGTVTVAGGERRPIAVRFRSSFAGEKRSTTVEWLLGESDGAIRKQTSELLKTMGYEAASLSLTRSPKGVGYVGTVTAKGGEVFDVSEVFSDGYTENLSSTHVARLNPASYSRWAQNLLRRELKEDVVTVSEFQRKTTSWAEEERARVREAGGPLNLAHLIPPQLTHTAEHFSATARTASGKQYQLELEIKKPFSGFGSTAPKPTAEDFNLFWKPD